MFGLHWESLDKLGKVVAHCEDVATAVCGWSERANKVDSEMMPRRYNGYWVKLRSHRADLPASSLADITNFNL